MNFSYLSKLRLFLFAALLLTASCADKPDAARFTRPEEIQKVRHSVVRVTTQLKNEKTADLLNHGSGFFISEKYVATALHVWRQLDDKRNELGGREKAEIVITQRSDDGSAGFIVPARYVSIDEDNDIAILGFDSAEIQKQWQDFQIQPLKLDDELPNIGDEILLTGYYTIYPQPFSSIGTVSMITEDKLKVNNVVFNQAIFSDSTAIPGHSGAPVYSFRTHKVIGIQTRILNPNQENSRITIATNSRHLKKLLDVLTEKDAGSSNKQ